MNCRNCNYTASNVVHTKVDEVKRKVYRQRECLKCGTRFKTHESLAPSLSSYQTPTPKRVLGS